MTQAILDRLGIRVRSHAEGRWQKVLCPRCSHTRRKKREPCLRVKIDRDGVVFHCFNCGWKGKEFKRDERRDTRRRRGGAAGQAWY